MFVGGTSSEDLTDPREDRDLEGVEAATKVSDSVSDDDELIL